MTPDRLLTHFDRIAEAPDAIPRLRQFILDLAVRGKLVEQDPNDEPAAELLKRIQVETGRLVKEGKIKKQATLLPVNIETVPFTVPKHWAWLQLCGIGTLSGGMTPSKNRQDFWDGNINWFSPKDIKSDELIDSELKITGAGVAETGLQVYPPGCLFMVARSGILKRTFPVAINRVEATANQDLKILNPFLKGIERYLQIMFRGMTDYILSALVKTGTTVQSLKYEEFELQPLPLPPLAEQHRIVAKVDELMALCNRMEAAQAERERRRDRLAAASLHRLNNGADAAEFREHARFHLDQLARFTTRPDQIPALRQTILNLAVRGKLVPQDPNDEPACVSLKQIHSDSSSISYDSRVFSEALTSFTVPPHWSVHPLARVASDIVDCPHSTPKWTTEGEICVRTNQFRPGHLDLSDVRFVSEATYLERIQRLEPIESDILYSREGGILGIACRVPPNTKLCLGQRMMLIRAGMATDAAFLEMVLNSPLITEIARGRTTGGAAPRVNVATVKAYPIPVPPIAEQHRIVAKVEELFALCNQLEAQLTNTQTERRRLLESVLHEALAPAA